MHCQVIKLIQPRPEPFVRPNNPDAEATLAYAIANLTYDPETGELLRSTKDGLKRAGAEGVNGYRQIGVCGRNIVEHRLIWLMVYGQWPVEEIDHINGIRNDNRFCNLREATRQQNAVNRKTRKKSGLKGAMWHKGRRRWMATIRGKHLGTYWSEEAAHAAYMRAADREFGEFNRAS